MATVDVSSENHEDVIKDGVSILYFTADWCPPCQQFRPIFAETSEEFPAVTFGKVDVDHNQRLAALYGVRSIPTIVAHQNGKPVLRQIGTMPAPEFKRFVEKSMES